MTASVLPDPPASDARVQCPGCLRDTLTEQPDWSECRNCLTRYRLIEFMPLLDVAELATGDGRCANHPGKDAANACTRCGSFVCDVCVTRTGEDVFCPDCFSLLHARGELATTQVSRTRWDHLNLALSLVAAVTCGVLLPLTLGLSVWLIWRLRRDRWMRVSYVAIAAGLNLLMLIGFGLMLVGAFS